MDNSTECFSSRLPVLLCSTRWVAHVNRSSVLNTPAGIHRSGLLLAFKWLLLSPAQDGKAQHFKLANPSAPRAKLPPFHSAATPKESQLFIYNLLWKSPQFFIAINNWAVWSGHSTKGCSIHSEAWGGGSLSSMSRGRDTHTHSQHTLQHGGDLGALLPFLCSCRSALRATSPPLCLHSATLLSPQSEERPASASWDTPQIAGV